MVYLGRTGGELCPVAAVSAYFIKLKNQFQYKTIAKHNSIFVIEN